MLLDQDIGGLVIHAEAIAYFVRLGCRAKVYVATIRWQR